MRRRESDVTVLHVDLGGWGGTDQLSSFEHHIIKSNRSITAKLLPNKGELIDKDVRITRSMILPSLSWGKIIKVDRACALSQT